MKKQIVYIVTSLLLALPMMAQEGALPTGLIEQEQKDSVQHYSQGHVISLGFGAGVSGLRYRYTQSEVSNVIHYVDMTANFRYSYFFKNFIGFTTGLDFSTYGANFYMDKKMTWNGVDPTLLTTDKSYTHILDFSDKGKSSWRESQSIYLLEIPIALSFKAKPDKVGFLGSLGLKIGVPISGSYIGQGVLWHMGEVAAAGSGYTFTPDNASNHFVEEVYSGKTSLYGKIPMDRITNISCGGFVELGVLFQVAPRVDMSVSAYANLGFTDLNSTPNAKREELGFGTARNGLTEHGVMNEYRGLLGTQSVDDILPWNCGIKLAIHINASKSDEQRAAEKKVSPSIVYIRDTVQREVIVRDTIKVNNQVVIRDTVRMSKEVRVRDTVKVVTHDTIRTIEHVAKELDDLLQTTIIYFSVADYQHPIVEPAYVLDTIAAILVRHPSMKISVEGHASADGSAETNRRLAIERARRIAEELEMRGVRERQMIVRSYGSNHPYRYNVLQGYDAAKDRRVEIIPISAK